MGWLILFIVLGLIVYLIVNTSNHKQKLNQNGGVETKYQELINWLSKVFIQKNIKRAWEDKILISKISYCSMSITIETTISDYDIGKVSTAEKREYPFVEDKFSFIDITGNDSFVEEKSTDRFLLTESNSGKIKIEWENSHRPKVTYSNSEALGRPPLISKLSWNYGGEKTNLEILREILFDINKLCTSRNLYIRENQILENKDIRVVNNDGDIIFSELFTKTQKLSVIRLAWLLAGINEELYTKAQQPVQSIYQALNLPFISDILQKSRTISSENACANLKNHPEKDWILVSLYSVAMADGKQSKEKEQLLSMYLRQLNVSQAEFQNVINKSISISNRLNK